MNEIILAYDLRYYFHNDEQGEGVKATAQVSGLIHTCDFLGVNYFVNFSVHTIAKNGYIIAGVNGPSLPARLYTWMTNPSICFIDSTRLH